MRQKISGIFIHLTAWLAFLSLPYIFKPVRQGKPKGTLVDDLLLYPRLANSFLLIMLFYITYYIILPRFYLTKKYVYLSIYFLASLALFTFMNYTMRPAHFHHSRGWMDFFGPAHNLFMFIIVFVFTFALFLYNQWQKTKEAHLNTEISFLKAQINPHFLFNTLNSIYSLTLTKSDNAPEAVVKLSSLMRYTITEANNEYVSLTKEIDYISDYISLQKLRLTNKVTLIYNIEGEANGQQIAPFMLIPFIENAFKHGVNSEENSRIEINIQITGSKLLLRVSNNKVYVQKDKNEGTGLGIGNTRQRLTLLYPDRHKLVVNDGDDNYDVSLQISLS